MFNTIFSFLSDINVFLANCLDESDLDVSSNEDSTHETSEESDDEESDANTESCNEDNAGRSDRGALHTRGTRTNSGSSCFNADFSISDLPDLQIYVNEYIDNEFCKYIVEKSNQSAIERNRKPLNLSTEECQTFIGITLLMSCINYPHVRMYWDRKYAFPIITEAMSRNRFIKIRHSLKLVYDLDITPRMRQNDKLWKVRPMLDRVLQGCHAQKRHDKMFVDKITISSMDTLAHKKNVYFPGEPHLNGLKAYILANPNGLVCDLLVYLTKDTMHTTKSSFRESVISKLTETLDQNHVIYCDRSFTNLKVIYTLKKRGIRCVQTVKKQNSSFLKDNLESIKLLSRGNKCSDTLANQEDEECNSMGGVSVTNKLLAVCPAKLRSKINKWTVRFIEQMLDLVIVNSWIKYNEDKKAMGIPVKKILTIREFKHQIAEKMILENTYKKKTIDEHEVEEVDNIRRPGRPGLPLPPIAKRLHEASHLPERKSKPMRCRNNGCQGKTTVFCINCNMHLCLTTSRNCFREFHGSMRDFI